MANGRAKNARDHEGRASSQQTATARQVLEITIPVTRRHQPRRLPVQDATSASAG